VQEGDLVVFWESVDNFTQAIIKKDDFYQNSKGKFLHNQMINKVEFGSKMFTQKGYCTLIKPNTHLYSASL
jgi:tRNA A58 N-methylase Trm61